LGGVKGRGEKRPRKAQKERKQRINRWVKRKANSGKRKSKATSRPKRHSIKSGKRKPREKLEAMRGFPYKRGGREAGGQLRSISGSWKAQINW